MKSALFTSRNPLPCFSWIQVTVHVKSLNDISGVVKLSPMTLELKLTDLQEILLQEVVERYEEGCDLDVEEYQASIRGSKGATELAEIYRELQNLPTRKRFDYREPSDLKGILMERPTCSPSLEVRLSPRQLYDKVLGAWLGRIAGCMLGKPVEGWRREWIRDALEKAGEYPLKGPYFPSTVFHGLSEKQLAYVSGLTREGIKRAERDDDLDYTILNLMVYEAKGSSFTSEDVAEAWLNLLPYHQTYTAERAAYRNLVIGLKPPETAVFLNPYREWIGAQIRADLWGYVSPGNPSRAAELAYRDARLSHTKNGIYGEMYFAAAVALAYAAEEPEALVRGALNVIPAQSRLAEAVNYTLNLWRSGICWEEAIDKVLEKYGSYHSVHTINNAAVVVAALLWGEGDFTQTITYAVTAGLDTDCNGATAGSIIGLMKGASRLPEEWVKPLNNTLISGLSGVGTVSITELAERTARVAQ